MEKGEQSVEPPLKRKKDKGSPPPMCIVHFSGIAHGTFKHFIDKNTNEQLNKILEIKKQRLDETIDSRTRMQQQCSLIPSSIDDHHGYHWSCYKRFTGNLDRLRRNNLSQSGYSPRVTPKRRSPRNKDSVVSKDVCIFYDSEGKSSVKTSRQWTTQRLSKFTRDDWVSVLEMAEKKNDYIILTRIRHLASQALEDHQVMVAISSLAICYGIHLSYDALSFLHLVLYLQSPIGMLLLQHS